MHCQSIWAANRKSDVSKNIRKDYTQYILHQGNISAKEADYK